MLTIGADETMSGIVEGVSELASAGGGFEGGAIGSEAKIA
jgi:hypothetical protein